MAWFHFFFFLCHVVIYIWPRILWPLKPNSDQAVIIKRGRDLSSQKSCSKTLPSCARAHTHTPQINPWTVQLIYWLMLNWKEVIITHQMSTPKKRHLSDKFSNSATWYSQVTAINMTDLILRSIWLPKQNHQSQNIAWNKGHWYWLISWLIWWDGIWLQQIEIDKSVVVMM